VLFVFADRGGLVGHARMKTFFDTDSKMNRTRADIRPRRAAAVSHDPLLDATFVGHGSAVVPRSGGAARPPGDLRRRPQSTRRLVRLGAGPHAALAGRGVAFRASPQKLSWGYGDELVDPDGHVVCLWDETSMAAHS
jgi:hypothetical protein